MYILLYQLILFNKVRMLKADIFEIVCVCFHVLICLLSFFFLDLRPEMTRLLKTDVDIHVEEQMWIYT